jgi:hypothetical protein
MMSRSRFPPPPTQGDRLTTTDLSQESVVCRRAKTMCTVTANENEFAVIQFAGNGVIGPPHIKEALLFVAATERFAVGDLPDTLDADAKRVLVSRLIRNGLLTLSNETAGDAARTDGSTSGPHAAANAPAGTEACPNRDASPQSSERAGDVVDAAGLPRQAGMAMTWTPQKQWIRFDCRQYSHEGSTPTAPSHDLAHLMIAANGHLLWAPEGDQKEIKIAEYNAIFLETCLNNILMSFTPGKERDCDEIIRRTLTIARWFVEEHYAPFPISAEESYEQFCQHIDPDRITELSKFYFAQRRAELADADFMFKSWAIQIPGAWNSDATERSETAVRPVLQALAHYPRRQFAK